MMGIAKNGLRFVLHSIPFKRQLYGMLKKIYQPSEKIYRHLYFTGPFNAKLRSGKSFRLNHFGTAFENTIFWEGLDNCWEKRSVAIWAVLSKQSQVILDIGANTGVFALVAKAANPESDVHAFEPLPKMFDKLVVNIDLSDGKIHPYQLAISNKTGKTKIYDIPSDYIRQASLNPRHLNYPNLQSSEVNTIRLDDFIEKHEILQVDLMKVDVETFEPEVMEGMGMYLYRFRPIVFVEVLDKTIGKRLLEVFEKADYRHFYNIDEDLGINRVDTLGDSRHRNYISTCTPLESIEELKKEWQQR